MQEMLEQYYEEADPEFLNLVESYGGSRDDKKIEELIECLYEFSRSYPKCRIQINGMKMLSDYG